MSAESPSSRFELFGLERVVSLLVDDCFFGLTICTGLLDRLEGA
jgi:hypothetical protein